MDQIEMPADIEVAATVRLGDIKDPDEWGSMASRLGWGEEERAKFLECGEYAEVVLVVRRDGAVVGGRLVPRKTEDFEFLVNETPVSQDLLNRDVVIIGNVITPDECKVLRQLLHDEIYLVRTWAGEKVVPMKELHEQRARALAHVMDAAGLDVSYEDPDAAA
jgi:hypothetical protein